MQKPNPDGGYPLVLRDANEESVNNRFGELILDYTNNKLYYINKSSKEKIDLSKSIYDHIDKYNIENTKINVCKDDENISSDEPIIPEISNRHSNIFFMNIIETKSVDDGN